MELSDLLAGDGALVGEVEVVEGLDLGEAGGFDPVLAAVLANRLDGIVREMTNTLLRAARSALINTGRDFSCAITTADNQLLAVSNGGGGSADMEEDAWSEFHTLPKVYLLAFGRVYIRPT